MRRAAAVVLTLGLVTIAAIEKMGRMITPISIPLTPHADRPPLDLSARVLFDDDGDGDLRGAELRKLAIWRDRRRPRGRRHAARLGYFMNVEVHQDRLSVQDALRSRQGREERVRVHVAITRSRRFCRTGLSATGEM